MTTFGAIRWTAGNRFRAGFGQVSGPGALRSQDWGPLPFRRAGRSEGGRL